MAYSYLDSTLESVKYHIETQDFDGPIDLLVKMVRESKIDVMKIFVSDITDQYVAYVQKMKELDYEYISKYLVMAAILIEIKSSKLVTYDDDDPYQADLHETEKNIIADVEQQLLTTAPEKLRPLEVTNVFYPEPKYDKEDYQLIVKGISLEQLLDAYKIVLEKKEVETLPQEQTIEKERYSVSDKVREFAQKIRAEKKLRLFDLFGDVETKSDLLNVFLSVLILIKKQIATAEQGEYQGDIILINNEENTKNIAEEEFQEDVDEYN